MIGYSTKLLKDKLGYKPGLKVCWINVPDNYLELINPVPQDLVITQLQNGLKDIDLLHFFTDSYEAYQSHIELFKTIIKKNGIIWISWPKKSSKVQSDITEDLIRKYALEVGLVDVKVCSIDQVWSGLKLVIPLKLR